VNIFLIHEDADQSAVDFTAMDRVRANKQLVECCQILATADHLMHKSTKMIKMDGTPYRVAYADHPLVILVSQSLPMWELCRDVAAGLAVQRPNHACTASLLSWMYHGPVPPSTDTGLMCFRKGQPPIRVLDRAEYARVMYAYLITKRGEPLHAT